MATDSRQISATLFIQEIEEIQELADKEARGSFSFMVAKLLGEALQNRKTLTLLESNLKNKKKLSA